MMELAELKVNPVAFLEKFFLLKDTGKYIGFFDWQKDFLRALFSEKEPIRLAICSACKKTGKTVGVGTGAALYTLMCWPAYPPVEVYFLANSLEQGKSLAFSELVWTCKNQPDLAKATTVYRDRVVVNSTGAFAKALPTKAKTVAGLAPSLTIWDEAHGLQDSDESLWSEMTSIQTKRSISLVLSYAGIEGQSNLLQRLYDIGVSDDRPDSWLFFWSHDPKISGNVDDAFLEAKRLELLPHQFSRLFENKWTSAAGSFITREQWDKCLDPQLKALPPSSTELMFLGLDCGLRRDSAVLTGVVKEGDLYKLALFRVWLPGRGKKNEIELEGIYTYLLNLHQTYNVAGCWFDPRFLDSISQRLKQAGLNMISVSQQPSSISRCYENLYQVITGRRFTHWGEPTLTKHMMNCVATDGPAGIMLEKGGTRSHKIDGAVSLALACFGGSKHIETSIKVHRAVKQPRPAPITPTSASWTRLHGLTKRKRSGKMGESISDMIKEVSR